MEHGKAFYQTIFKHDTLFRVAGDLPQAQPLDAVFPVKVAQTPAAEIPKPVVQEPPRETAPVPAFPRLSHKVLVLVDSPGRKELSASETTLLHNILKAIGFTTDTADVLNFSNLTGTDARKVLAEKSTHYFISFGVPLIKLQLDLVLPPYSPKEVEGIWFLLADGLASVDAEVTLKKQLWGALQRLFPKK